MQCLAVILVSLCALANAKSVPTHSVGVATLDDAVMRRELQRHFTMRSLPCSCEGLTCSCCATINIQQVNFNQQGCVNFTYDASSLAVAMNVLANNRSLYETSISGRNPPPFCVPIPQFPAVMFCARFYDIHQEGGNVVACIKLEVQAFTTTVIVINFDCIKIGVDGVAIVKPSAQLNIERPLADLKPKPPTEVVIVLHPTSSTSVSVPTYDIGISLATDVNSPSTNEAEPTTNEAAPSTNESAAAGSEVDDLDAVDEDLKRGTTTESADSDEDYDEEEVDKETVESPKFVESPKLVETVVKVKRIVGDYKNSGVVIGEESRE